MNKKELKITRVFDAPREMVWKAWTEPKQLMKWWGPKSFTSPVAKIDLRVGGKYLYCMRSPDGHEYWSGGTYQEIIPFEKIVCTEYGSNKQGHIVHPSVAHGVSPDFPNENVVTITFEEVDGKTKLTVLYVPESEAALEAMLKIGMKSVWESTLEKLAESLK